MKNYEEIKSLFSLEGEKVYFNNKGCVNPEKVTITEDYIWSECGGMLYGSELECYIVMKEEKELSDKEYNLFRFAYKDERETYNESGEKYEKGKKGYNYSNNGVNLKGCEVYILYNNYNNNSIDSYNIDIYSIK